MAEVNCENLQTAISDIDDEKYRNLFNLFVQKLDEKDKEITQLTNRVDEIEQRVLDHEHYSSKDSLTFQNVQVDKNIGLEREQLPAKEQHLSTLMDRYPDYASRLNILPSLPPPLDCDVIVQERLGNKRVIRLLGPKVLRLTGGFLIRHFKHQQLNEQEVSKLTEETQDDINPSPETKEVSSSSCFIPDLNKQNCFFLENVEQFKNPHFISKRINKIIKFLTSFEQMLDGMTCSNPGNIQANLVIMYPKSRKQSNNGTICDFSDRIKQRTIETAFKNFQLSLTEFYLDDPTSGEVYENQLNDLKSFLMSQATDGAETRKIHWAYFWAEFMLRSVPETMELQVKTSKFTTDDKIDSFYINWDGIVHFLDSYGLFTKGKITTVPEFDKIQSCILYETDSLLGVTIYSEAAKKHRGEFEMFWPQFQKWVEKDTTGLLLHGFSNETFSSILNQSIPGFDFEFDWLLFTQSQLFLIEVKCCDESKNIEKFIQTKLDQVFTRHLPSIQFIIWQFMQHIRKTDKFPNLETNCFEVFFTQRFSVIVFLAGVKNETVKKSLAKVISKPKSLDFKFEQLSELGSQSVYFVGGDPKSSQESGQFLRIERDSGDGIKVIEEPKSPMQMKKDDFEGPGKSLVQILGGIFALPYGRDASKNETVQSIDEKLTSTQQNYVCKLGKQNQLSDNFIQISDLFSVILSPQQIQILAIPEKRLIIAGEPGTGKTILLLTKALDALWKKEINCVYFCSPKSKIQLRNFAKTFTEQANHLEYFEGKFHFLDDTMLMQLNDVSFNDLQNSMLLVDEYYFDYEESFELQSNNFFDLRKRVLPHLKYCWMTDVVLRKESLYRHRKETVGKYFPVEMFTIKSLNVQYRSSCHIAELCSKLHGTSRGFTGSRTSGVFTSSQVECGIFSFAERTKISLDCLAEKFGKSNRWAVVLCDSGSKETWQSFLQYKQTFAQVFVISWLDGPVKCNFSGAEIFSLTLFLDSSNAEEKADRETIEEMYKLIISRAQYELYIFVHDSLSSEFEMFLSCRKSESSKRPKKEPFLVPHGDEIAVVYKTITGGNDPSICKTLSPALKKAGLSKCEELCRLFLEGKENREIFVLLGRKFGHETIRGLISHVYRLTESSEKPPKRSKVLHSLSDFLTTLKDIVIHALRINNKEVLEWVFQLIDFTETKEAIEQDIDPEGPSKNLILLHTCFKPQLMKLCWEKLHQWGLLQHALRSKLHVWQNVCGILPILCYANAQISENPMKEYLKFIPRSLIAGTFCGKNALEHAMEHENFESVETIMALDGAEDLTAEGMLRENEIL